MQPQKNQHQRGRHFALEDVAGVGRDSGDAGTDVLAADDRGVADLHPRNIGDCVRLAGL